MRSLKKTFGSWVKLISKQKKRHLNANTLVLISVQCLLFGEDLLGHFFVVTAIHEIHIEKVEVLQAP